MKRIGIMTGTRAEYGLLKSLMQEINKDNDLELYLIVSGMHLSPEFGMTYSFINSALCQFSSMKMCNRYSHDHCTDCR